MAKYYNTIDVCPILVFNNIMTGKKDFSTLCYEGKSTDDKARKSWGMLFDEYIKEFGLPSSYTQYLKDMVKVCELWNKAYNEGRKDLKTMAIHKEKLASLHLNTGEAQSFNKIIAQVSRFMGYQIDPNSTSVRQFYGYIELMNGK